MFGQAIRAPAISKNNARDREPMWAQISTSQSFAAPLAKSCSFLMWRVLDGLTRITQARPIMEADKIKRGLEDGPLRWPDTSTSFKQKLIQVANLTGSFFRLSMGPHQKVGGSSEKWFPQTEQMLELIWAKLPYFFQCCSCWVKKIDPLVVKDSFLRGSPIFSRCSQETHTCGIGIRWRWALLLSAGATRDGGQRAWHSAAAACEPLACVGRQHIFLFGEPLFGWFQGKAGKNNHHVFGPSRNDTNAHEYNLHTGSSPHRVE